MYLVSCFSRVEEDDHVITIMNDTLILDVHSRRHYIKDSHLPPNGRQNKYIFVFLSQYILTDKVVPVIVVSCGHCVLEIRNFGDWEVVAEHHHPPGVPFHVGQLTRYLPTRGLAGVSSRLLGPGGNET